MEAIVNDAEIYKSILDAAKAHTQYTAVILIARKENNALKFLCREDDSFLFHCPLDPEKTIDEGISLVRDKICDTFEIDDTDIVNIAPFEYDPIYTVKYISQAIQSVALVLYKVQLDKSVKEGICKRETVWKTIDEMAKNPKAMKSNYDVIEWLQRHRGNLHDSFVLKPGTLHIIWNITGKCHAGCKICATRDLTRIEVWPEDKLRILNALAEIKREIKSIDCAGGDPCQDETCLEIIDSAVQIFGKDKVSVTTTATGIKNVPENMRRRILTNCELTLDVAHSFLKHQYGHEATRGTENYSRKNLEAINESADVIKHLTINIPLLNSDLTDDEINTLVNAIKKIKDKYKKMAIDAVLIRLIPVGNHGILASAKEYEKYNPLSTAEQIKRALSAQDIRCKYHCSLRTLDCHQSEKNERCTMLDRKIGIDCAGNVFACAWGGYLPNIGSIADNPFYLGNVLQRSLSDILSSTDMTPAQRRIRIKNDNSLKRNYCEVVSRYFSPDSDSNNDPLAQEDTRS